MTKLYVNYGCGVYAPNNWVNFDSSPNLTLERLPLVGKLYAGSKGTGNGNLVKLRYPAHIKCGDIVKGLPISQNSCAGIYASHVLEHLSLSDFRSALSNTFIYLAPNGIFRMVVPDLEILVRKYMLDENPDASIKFLQSSGLGQQTRARGIKSLLNGLLSNSNHLWMWDYKSLEYELIQVGFSSVRRAYFNDSSDPRFLEVEQKDRFIDSVAVEALK